MTKILPFSKDVPCISYHYIAFPLGVMKASLPDFDIWLCNKLIQTKYESATNRYAIVDNDLWSEKDHITTVPAFHITTDIFRCPSFDFINLIINMLDQSHYIGGVFDEFFIPSKTAFNNYHRPHDFFVFGYDDSKRVFHSVGYLSDGKYNYFEIRFQDFYNSLVYYNFYRLSLFFYKINPRSSSLQTDIILSQIKSYLTSSNPINNSPDNEFGISVWRRLANHILDPSVQQLDVRAFRAFLEHKSIMLHRIRQLEINKGGTVFGLLFEEKIKKKASEVFLLSLKYSLTQRRNLLLVLSSKISDICDQENQLLSEFITSFS